MTCNSTWEEDIALEEYEEVQNKEKQTYKEVNKKANKIQLEIIGKYILLNEKNSRTRKLYTSTLHKIVDEKTEEERQERIEAERKAGEQKEEEDRKEKEKDRKEREKEMKQEQRNIKRNYNKEVQAKEVDTGVQFRFNYDLMCAIGKFEKSRDEKRNAKKRQNLEIRPAVARKQIG